MFGVFSVFIVFNVFTVLPVSSDPANVSHTAKHLPWLVVKHMSGGGRCSLEQEQEQVQVQAHVHAHVQVQVQVQGQGQVHSVVVTMQCAKCTRVWRGNTSHHE